MNNETIIQIAADNGELYALTETGKVAYYDKHAGAFVLKSAGEVLDATKANVLKKSEMPAYVAAPQGRYRVPDEVGKEEQSRIRVMMTPANIAIALIALAILVYLFVLR